MSDVIAASNIAAQAFRMMQLAPISSFSDDSDQALDAAEQYPIALNMALGFFDWSFARITYSLPEIDTVPDGIVVSEDLPNLYALPGDLIKLRKVVDDDVNWRRDGEFVHADQPSNLVIRYTRAVDNEKLLPAEFQTYVAGQLAILLGPRWMRDKVKLRELKSDIAGLRQEAIDGDVYDASPSRTDDWPEQDDWAQRVVC
ncbi:MAG: hypothetical protein AAFU41_00840 [Pseudomonadota bacterium]